MVSGVQNALGSTAYMKSSQLGGQQGNTQNIKRTLEQKTEESFKAQETKRSEKSDEVRESLRADSRPTQLEDRNDRETLKTEQARGSLLDIAV